MIGLGIGVAWAYKKINRYIANLILSFRLRVLAAGGVFEAEPCLENQLISLQGIGLLNDASLLVTPNAYKAGVLYDIVPNTTLGDLDVVRATSATRVDANGLVEIPRTNLVTYSEEFDTVFWTKLALTVTPNTTTSPNGTTNADTLNIGVDASATRHRIISNATATQTIGTTYTGTFYLKKASQRWVQIIGNIGYSSGVWANFDIENGVIGNTGGVDTTATIENVGNGWYRCRVSGVATATSTTGFELLAINNTNGIRYPSYQSLVAESVCFVWGAQTEVGSTATEYIPTVGSIRTKFAGITQDGSSASNIPRLDYTNGSCPSILVEPQRTNIALRSEEFNVSPWSTLGTTTITPNATNSPSGNSTADLILGADSFSSVNQIITGTTGVVYTNSFYIKNNNSTQSRLTIRNTITAVDCNINWSGSILSSITNLTGTTTFQNVGNGWYRIISTYTAVEAPQRPRIIPTQTTNQSVYLWGAQLEVGANATSYIPTTSASVTRNADVISKTGISSLIGQTEGTVFLNVKALANDNTTRQISISDNSFNNYVRFSFAGATNFATASLISAGNTQASNDFSLNQTNTNKIAIKYNTNLFEIYVNGVLIHQDLSVNTFSGNTLSSLQFSNPLGGGIWCGNLNSIQLYKTALTDAECISLTTL
jgi:hypothetical protein